MRIVIAAVGKVRGAVAPAVREFEARAGRYWKMEVIEVDAGTGRGGQQDPDAVMEAEAGRFRDRVPGGAEVWALTRSGKRFSTPEFARNLGERALRGGPEVAFLVGGAFGLAPELVGRAAVRLSLSSMTLPHEVARLVLAEQLYRSGTILRNEPYHKGPR